MGDGGEMFGVDDVSGVVMLKGGDIVGGRVGLLDDQEFVGWRGDREGGVKILEGNGVVVV